jgi:hypothetical protein
MTSGPARRRLWPRLLVGVLALAGLILSIWQLEADRDGLVVDPLPGAVPATVFRAEGAGPAPVVVIAHGFAGSSPLMDAFSIALAQAGYVAVSFDFRGHGRNPLPMSGDVTSVDGTTRLLMDDIAAVSDAALALPQADGRLALLGHSMASDIVIRQALRDPRVQAVVAVSMFSRAVTEAEPRNLLVLPGEWEGRLTEEALRVLRLADPAAELGQTVGEPSAGTGRRAVAVPGVEHVSVLYARTTLAETRDWLDLTFARPVSDAPLPARGGWIALMLLSVTALVWPLVRLLPAAPGPRPPLMPLPGFLAAAVLPAVAVPLILWPFDTRFLPVLVADYLALHLALYGLLALGLAALAGGWRLRLSLRDLALAGVVAGYGIVVIGGLLDRCVAAFWPVGGRWPILLAIAAGAIPYMLSDSALTQGGRAGLWRALVVRGAFLTSLVAAVTLDFGRLFFLLIILPVILLFLLIFGTMAGWIGRRTGQPAIAGLGLGVFLGWALSVTFPLFAP